MRSVSFSGAQAELENLLDDVTRDRTTIEIKRPNKPSAVLIDKRDYEEIAETLYLLSTPTNAKKLMESIDEANAGRIEFHDLVV